MGGPRSKLPPGRRSERFNRLLREEISRLLAREIRDPRISEVSITDVSTSEDLRHADIFYACREQSEEQRAEIQKGLERACGFLRGRLGRNLHIRKAPDIRFKLDGSIDYGAHIDTLLNTLNLEDEDGT